MSRHPNISNIPSVQFDHALRRVQDHGPLPTEYTIEFQQSQEGRGWRYASSFGVSSEHPLMHLSPSSPVHNLKNGPPEPGAVPCVMHPFKYQSGSYQWRKCDSAFEAVYESLVASGAKDPSLTSKAELSKSFSSKHQNYQNTCLYHPYDRDTALRFEYEEAAAKLCREYGRNLFLVTFRATSAENLNMGWCLVSPKDRLEAQSRWSVGTQEDLPCVPVGCLPEMQASIPKSKIIKGIWYVLTPVSDKAKTLHNIWKTTTSWDKKLAQSIAPVLGTVPLPAVPRIVTTCHRAVQWGMITEKDLGRYMVQVCTHFNDNARHIVPKRAFFEFDLSTLAPDVSMDRIAAYIVSSGEGSLAKRTAENYDKAAHALERFGKGGPWKAFVTIFEQNKRER